MALDHADIEKRSLAERYVAGALPEAEREAFEEHLVDCQPCLDRIEEAERIRAGLGALERVQVPAPVRDLPTRPWRRGAYWPGLALAAGLMVGLLPSLLLFLSEQRTARELGTSRARAASAEEQLGVLGGALREEQAARAGAEAELARAEQPQAVPVLELATTRGGAGGPVPVLRLPAGVPFALLAVETGGFGSYRARLFSADGRLLWEKDRLAATRYGVAVAMPARLLPAGTYRLELTGVGGARRAPAGEFEFEVLAGAPR